MYEVREHRGVIDASIATLWRTLAQEMAELGSSVLPTTSNAERWAHHVSAAVEHGEGCLFVATEKDRVVGFAYATYRWRHPMDQRYHVGSLDDLYVAPDVRRQGIGERLVRAALGRMKEEDVQRVRTSALASNGPAQRLYAKIGFAPASYRVSIDL